MKERIKPIDIFFNVLTTHFFPNAKIIAIEDIFNINLIFNMLSSTIKIKKTLIDHPVEF